jgi:hypothetical protein
MIRMSGWLGELRYYREAGMTSADLLGWVGTFTRGISDGFGGWPRRSKLEWYVPPLSESNPNSASCAMQVGANTGVISQATIPFGGVKER